MQDARNLAHVEPALCCLKKTPKGEVKQRGQVRHAGAEGLLLGLFGSRKTHFQDPHICVKDQCSKTDDHSEHVKESIDVTEHYVSAPQLHNTVVGAVHTINNVPTQLRGGVQGDHHNYASQRQKPGEHNQPENKAARHQGVILQRVTDGHIPVIRHDG